MKIVLASNNKNKLREIRQIIEPLGHEIYSLDDMNIDIDPDETGSTFEKNAYIKAKAVYDFLDGKYAVIADDSGLEVDWLGKAPGVYSARYGGENASDSDKCRKILSELGNIPEEKRNAGFVCVICFIDLKGSRYSVRGECRGYIGYEPKGENGFGYDPIFMYGDKSFAEIPADVKNKISHRAAALEKFSDMLKEKYYADK